MTCLADGLTRIVGLRLPEALWESRVSHCIATMPPLSTHQVDARGQEDVGEECDGAGSHH